MNNNNTSYPEERFFYHNFPRRYKDNKLAYIEKGLSILSSIKKSGFVLTPEITEWAEPLSNGTHSKPWKVAQKRCCFTELAPSEVVNHSEMFGKFALEIEISVFRQLGGIPVFYLPRPSEEDKGLESLASALLSRIGEIQVLLNRLGELEELVKNTPDKNQILTLVKNTKVLGSIQCSIGGAESLISYLSYGSQPITILRNALRALSGFFYPTEDLHYTGALAYYRQREWRIIANMSKLGKELTRNPTAEEKERLIKVDNEFFNREIELHTGKYKQVDQCQIFDSLEGKPIIEFVRRVIVPSKARELATEILSSENDPIVVDLESITKD